MNDPDLTYAQVNLNESIDDVKIPKTFDCGDPFLDKYVTSGNLKRAIKSENLHATGLFDESQNLIGFMTVGFGILDKARVKTFAKGNQPPQLPVAKVSMIAIDVRYQGRGLGTDLMLEAFSKAVTVHQTIPLKGVYLDAAPGKETFYSETFGFAELEGPGVAGTTPMYIPIEDVIASLQEADNPE
ncbi:GNAT family N-acetyltransferase [Pseudomonas fitomaticsae]